MYKIEAEKTSFWYFTGSLNIENLNDAPLKTAYLEERIIKNIISDFDVRIVIFENMLVNGKGDLYFLYWNNQKNLEELDFRISDGSYTNEDFEPSVKTVYQDTECFECDSIWKTLVIPPGDPYPGSPGLMEEKIQKSTFKLCPKCKKSLRQMVLKIFDWM